MDADPLRSLPHLPALSALHVDSEPRGWMDDESDLPLVASGLAAALHSNAQISALALEFSSARRSSQAGDALAVLCAAAQLTGLTSLRLQRWQLGCQAQTAPALAAVLEGNAQLRALALVDCCGAGACVEAAAPLLAALPRLAELRLLSGEQRRLSLIHI